ncbi:phosphoglycolate phosphatase [Roseibium alexandrii]|uniref:Phosphoglycolate phosphatase n=1 Tax=Roseibium alexandrii (strain DSM 17067 / NCIMB 14079 / DFL-11) TaxID=244592 RepID=A0A5E8GWB1_ROSAD|nr:phosphoglycolate phosphatase [Roseibium alexandrii]EEE44250.2 2-phosphoglycolate phosphatase, prokaryotic [Roseibium alexandrii DFL-11]
MSVLVFDLDGTLVSSMEDLVATLNAVLEKAGHGTVPQDKVANMVGMGAKVLLQRGLDYLEIEWSDETIIPLYEDFLDYYAANIAVHTRPFDGVIPALQRFRADGWKLAVCTNKTERLTLPLLAALNMTDHFDAVVGGDTFSVSKPHAEPVLGAIQRAGGTLEGSIMIGDSVTDINAARAAGIPVVAVDFGYTPVPVTELGPDRIISHFDELADAVDGLRT